MRQTSIGGASETNATPAWPAATGGGSSGTGEQQSTPGQRELTRPTASGPRTAGSIRARGAIAQLGERLDRTQEVSGSSPLSSIAGNAALPQAVSSIEGAAEAPSMRFQGASAVHAEVAQRSRTRSYAPIQIGASIRPG